MRLEDTYYTTQKLDGEWPQEGVYQNTPTFYQGDDITFELVLNVDGGMVTTDKWDVNCVVKSSQYSLEASWTGKLLNGVYPIEGKPGMYQLFISRDQTSTWAAGTYWLGIQVTQHIGTGGLKDMSFTVKEIPFGLAYAVTSPLPESANPTGTKLDRSTLEITYPLAASTTGVASWT